MPLDLLALRPLCVPRLKNWARPTDSKSDNVLIDEKSG